MSDEPFALSPIPPSPPTPGDYEAICAAVMHSVRGRWFLEEYAKRNRHADTQAVLAAIERIEAVIRGNQAELAQQALRTDLLEMARTIARTRAEIADTKPDVASAGNPPGANAQAAMDVLNTAERLHDIAWIMRERRVEKEICEEVQALATQILTTSSFRDRPDGRVQRLAEVLQYLEHRVDSMLDSGTDGSATAAEDELAQGDAVVGPAPAPNGNGSHAASGPARDEWSGIDTAIQAFPTRPDFAEGFPPHCAIEPTPARFDQPLPSEAPSPPPEPRLDHGFGGKPEPAMLQQPLALMVEPRPPGLADFAPRPLGEPFAPAADAQEQTTADEHAPLGVVALAADPASTPNVFAAAPDIAAVDVGVVATPPVVAAEAASAAATADVEWPDVSGAIASPEAQAASTAEDITEPNDVTVVAGIAVSPLVAAPDAMPAQLTENHFLPPLGQVGAPPQPVASFPDLEPTEIEIEQVVAGIAFTPHVVAPGADLIAAEAGVAFAPADEKTPQPKAAVADVTELDIEPIVGGIAFAAPIVAPKPAAAQEDLGNALPPVREQTIAPEHPAGLPAAELTTAETEPAPETATMEIAPLLAAAVTNSAADTEQRVEIELEPIAVEPPVVAQPLPPAVDESRVETAGVLPVAITASAVDHSSTAAAAAEPVAQDMPTVPQAETAIVETSATAELVESPAVVAAAFEAPPENSEIPIDRQVQWDLEPLASVTAEPHEPHESSGLCEAPQAAEVPAQQVAPLAAPAPPVESDMLSSAWEVAVARPATGMEPAASPEAPASAAGNASAEARQEARIRIGLSETMAPEPERVPSMWAPPPKAAPDAPLQPAPADFLFEPVPMPGPAAEPQQTADASISQSAAALLDSDIENELFADAPSPPVPARPAAEAASTSATTAALPASVTPAAGAATGMPARTAAQSRPLVRPMPRPEPADPLAALRAMSDEERIALFT